MIQRRVSRYLHSNECINNKLTLIIINYEKYENMLKNIEYHT